MMSDSSSRKPGKGRGAWRAKWSRAPHRRSEVIAKLVEASGPVTVFVAPVIPAFTDHELENIVKAAAHIG